MKSDTPPSTECVGCGHEGHLWASGGVPWFWCLNDHCKYYIGTGPPHRIVVTGSSGAYRWYQAHINAIVRCLECDREYKPDDKRHYLTPESYRCPVCRFEYPVVKLIRRDKSKWSEDDMEAVAKAVLGSGVLGMPHFRWFMSSYYNEATSDDPRPDADLLPKQKGFMRLLPDLFNVTTVQHKATVLAAIYAYYTDTDCPDSEVEQSFKDDMPMLWWPLWSYDVQHAYLIDKRQYQTILSWVDEVAEACADATSGRERPGPKTDTKDLARDQQIFDEYQERRVKEGRGFTRKDFADSKNMKLSEFTKLYKRVHKRLEEDTKK